FPNHEKIDLYAKLAPAKEVGGDLYDFFIHGEKLFFAVGDASGKGVPASLLMAVTISLFRTISAHTQDPSEILESLNEAISDSNEANMFITLFVGVLDLETGELNYANAGHNPPILINPKGEVSFIAVDPNLALGIFPGIKFSVQTIKVELNSAIFAYSDGLTEAENAIKELYSEERLIANLSGGGFNLYNAKDVIDYIDQSVSEFVKENEQSDDLTMLMLSYK
ncbi:MAG: PP2C family protein-serine/threonine phosphatase, partial [Phocaeicola sp.]